MARRIGGWLPAASLVIVATTLAACGSSGTKSTTSATRTVSVEMRDIAFSPQQLDVHPGETVRFVFRNTGRIDHDAYIGSEAAQTDHEMEMSQAGESSHMQHGDSGDEGGITVKPGRTGELTHTFKTGESVLIGCHQPGHYSAGMKLMISQV